MDQIKKLIESLTWRQIVSIVAGAAAVIAALAWLSHWNRERDFRPLYSSLAPEDAAAVVAKIREGGSEYRLADNGSTVLVPSARVAELRLDVASAGLPKSGRIGFELFDKTGFGASDFTEQVNYHRALEGELERSVMSLGAVEQARVHITFPKDSLFLDSREPAKASALVKLHAGAQLAPQSVAAICQLVASAVEGLAPEAVSVLDTRGSLLNRARKPAAGDDPEPSEENIEYRQRLEHELVAKISHTLDPLLGANKYRATAAVECDFSSAEQSDETYDPSKSVMVSSQKTEDVSAGSTVGGIPGASSSLPRPAPRPAPAGNMVTRRTENINYQSSHTVRHVREPEGALKRMSVSLLVDSDVRYEGSGPKARRVLVPPSPDKLKTIHDLVAGVIGLNTQRGDQLVVETLPFESTLNPEQLPAPAPPAPVPGWREQLLKNKMFVIGVGVGAGLLLTLLLLAMRGSRRGTPQAADLPAELPAGAPLTPEQIQSQIENRLAEQAAQRQRQETEALNALKLPPVTKKTEVLTKHIAEQAKKDSANMAHVVRAWMAESGDEVRRT